MKNLLLLALAAPLAVGCGAGYVQRIDPVPPPALEIEFSGYGVRADEVVFRVQQIDLVSCDTGRRVWRVLPLQTVEFRPDEVFRITPEDFSLLGDAVAIPFDFQMPASGCFHYVAHVAVGPRAELHFVPSDKFDVGPDGAVVRR